MPLLDVVAYPFVEVKIVPPPAAVATRSPGVVAVVGITPDGASGGTAPVDAPRVVTSAGEAATLFASRDADGAVQRNALFDALAVALLQDPPPAKVYGVRAAAGGYAAALRALEGVDDVNFVSLARETEVDALLLLKAHAEDVSAAGSPRIAVAMADPTQAPSQTWAADTLGALTGAGKVLRSDTGRMIVVAARAAGTAPDFATAAMAAIAGQPPHVSPVLKQVRGVAIPRELGFSPTEIKALAAEGIIPIIDPALIPGEGLFMADGGLFTTDARRPFVDIVRVLDDIQFRLRAGLIGTIGDARITKPGLTLVKLTAEGIVANLRRQNVIDGYTVTIPLLELLSIPESARTAADTQAITQARATRGVDMVVAIIYGPQVHHLGVTLRMDFA
ncbi:hypothetical protein [Roseomonas sp. BN140053]|uniref:hypothetical protein n=1 Tax=Roseomonas sp. BN140053 TaxID=3391898 RepID=UPI0039EBFB9D